MVINPHYDPGEGAAGTGKKNRSNLVQSLAPLLCSWPRQLDSPNWECGLCAETLPIELAADPQPLGVDLDWKGGWEFECRAMSDKIVGAAVGGCGVVILMWCVQL